MTPYPPSRIRVRSFGFIRHLARAHTVTVLALARGDDVGSADDLAELRAMGVTVTLVAEPRYDPLLRTLRSAVLPGPLAQPLQVAFAAAPRLRAAIAREVREGDYDVLHVEHVRGLGALPSQVPIPVVWDAVDCVSMLFAEGARVSTSPMLRLIGPLEARRLRAYERAEVSRDRHVLVTSERDKQALLALVRPRGESGTRVRGLTDEAFKRIDEQIVVLPHGLDRSYFQPHRGPRQPREVIFSGKMSYHANVAGAQMLVARILPLIWREHPDVHLTIAGADPPADVRHLARDPRISVTGYVSDLRPLISAAQVSVSPLPYAVGIQNKVLEALALGTPVVASTSAAQGLQTVAGQDLLVCETAEDFAAAVCRVLTEPRLARSLVDHGLRYVATYHDWDTITDHLASVYAQAGAALAPAPTRAAVPAEVPPAPWRVARATTKSVTTAAHLLHVLGMARRATTETGNN